MRRDRMSGGSYNYLGFKDAERINDYMEELDQMIQRLQELGYKDIASDSQILKEHIEKHNEWVQKKIDELSIAWLAVEWYDSGGTGKYQLEGKIAKYREMKRELE